MAVIQRMCANHPDRRAIGVCVVTGKAICGECSTRYEGVNYSKEGLARLQAERARKQGGGGADRFISLLAVVLAPGVLVMLYLGFRVVFGGLLGLLQDVG